MAFSLFKTKHTGKVLNMVPVEKVGSAIRWLNEKGYQKIGMDGTSKGTEYTLAAACGKEIKYFIKSEKENPRACYAERAVMGEETIKWIRNVWR